MIHLLLSFGAFHVLQVVGNAIELIAGTLSESAENYSEEKLSCY